MRKTLCTATTHLITNKFLHEGSSHTSTGFWIWLIVTISVYIYGKSLDIQVSPICLRIFIFVYHIIRNYGHDLYFQLITSLCLNPFTLPFTFLLYLILINDSTIPIPSPPQANHSAYTHNCHSPNLFKICSFILG